MTSPPRHTLKEFVGVAYTMSESRRHQLGAIQTKREFIAIAREMLAERDDRESGYFDDSRPRAAAPDSLPQSLEQALHFFAMAALIDRHTLIELEEDRQKLLAALDALDAQTKADKDD